MVVYEIRYNANGGTGILPNTQTTNNLLPGDSQTLKIGYQGANTLLFISRTGYKFSGWGLIQNDFSYADNYNWSFSGEPGSGLTITYTLYIYWVGNTYSITYKKNDQSADADVNDSVSYPTNFTFKDASIFRRTGYTLKGWGSAPGSSTIAYTLGQVVQSYANNALGWQTDSNFPVYAIWEGNKYTVTYYKNDGSATANTSNVTYPSNFVFDNSTNSFFRIGYGLKGWGSTEVSSTITYTLGQIVQSSNVAPLGWSTDPNLKVYAIWEETSVNFSDIRKRFNPSGTGPISLDSYYNNGGIVSGITGIPSSGQPINLLPFKGK